MKFWSWKPISNEFYVNVWRFRWKVKRLKFVTSIHLLPIFIIIIFIIIWIIYIIIVVVEVYIANVITAVTDNDIVSVIVTMSVSQMLYTRVEKGTFWRKT